MTGKVHFPGWYAAWAARVSLTLAFAFQVVPPSLAHDGNGARSARTGAGYGAISGGIKMSAAQRAKLEAQIHANNAELAKINRKNKERDLVIALLSLSDLAIGISASLVPGGSIVYSGAKAVGYIATGLATTCNSCAKSAATAAFSGLLSGVPALPDAANSIPTAVAVAKAGQAAILTVKTMKYGLDAVAAFDAAFDVVESPR